ncbi:MAG: hypothetical protein ACYDCO_10395 [Armatimonadota bacterium]
MTVARPDRRHFEDGSLICENGHLRLRVTREGRSLALVVDTRGIDMRWGTFAFSSSGEDILAADADGVDQTGCFFTFDPLQIDGETRGVTLHGQLGGASLTLTATLDDTSTWCRLRLTATGVDGDCRRLTQQWRLFPGDVPPELCWPLAAVSGDALAYLPAAFVQDGPMFAALVVELDEEHPELYGLEVSPSDPICFEYGLWNGAPEGAPVQLAYRLGLDARALPERGFQQVARLLGSRDELALVGHSLAQPAGGSLPELPALGGAMEWHPFIWEGDIDTMTAVVRRHLAAAVAGDWQALEQGLCWLDRLCLHQRTTGAPGASTLGAFGPDAEWQTAAPWMPVLLMQAFKCTGIPEYAFRAQAALLALPAAVQSTVLAHLHPAFGDLYAQADYGELVPLSGPEVTAALFTTDGLCLDVPPDAAPFRLVLDGSDDVYALTVNGKHLGEFSVEELSAGIDLDPTV